MNAQQTEVESFNVPMYVTIFHDVRASTKTQSATPWRDVVRQASNPREYASKAAMPLIKLADFGEVRTAKGSLRSDENLDLVYGVEGDYDAGKVTLLAAAELLGSVGIEAILYTTPSSRPDAPRWRVLLPLSAACEPAQRAEHVGRVNAVLGGILAGESFTASLAFYFGKVRGVHYESQHVRGRPIDEFNLFLDPVYPAGKLTESDPSLDDNERALMAMKPLLGWTLAKAREVLMGCDPNADRDHWVKALMALHHELDGSDEGLALADEWSAGGASYQGIDDVRGRWDSFGSGSATITGAWLLKWHGQCNPAPTAGAVIDALRLMSKADIQNTWKAHALPLARDGAQEVIEEVARLTGAGPRVLSAALNEARAKAAGERKREAVERRAGTRKLMVYRPEDRTEQAAEVEAEIVAHAAPGEYVIFAGVPSQVTIKPMPGMHLIDDTEGASPTVPQIEAHDEVSMLRHVEQVAVFSEMRGDAPQIIGVPDRLIEILIKTKSHVAPAVTGLVPHPIVLPDGEILAADGLHASGLYLSGATLDGATPYNQAQSTAALMRIKRGLFAGFEFATPLDADVALAGLFTGVQRRVCDMAPGIAVLANTPSSGKTTLARMLHVILTAQDMPVAPFSLGNEEETRKGLLSMLLRSPAMVCYDNIPDGFTFRSGAIAAAMTASSVQQRLLGVSRDVDCPTNVLFALTGNNLSLGSDEVSRWVTCHLAPKTSRPEERTFDHQNIVGHVLKMRAEVLRDVVGIVSGFLRSGATLGLSGTRFPQWDRQVRQPLVWAGAADVAQVFRANADDSEDVRAHRGLLCALWSMFGEREFTASDVASGGMETDGTTLATLRASLESLAVKDVTSARGVGRVLAAKCGRVAQVDGREAHIAKRYLDRDGSLRYSVVIGPCGV